ncbi:AP-4 complex subunit mu-1 [Liparis tanakae]|uniref:AP-4 complex subunit mu-1 n=1 Tax=Liparis tanakae TaxID=230148 RepID=A0A4Z2FZM8_9TELE|nr:AP-4 complex subunit mu-1 [Liparis tanakae]
MQCKAMDTTGPKRAPSWLRSGRGGALFASFSFAGIASRFAYVTPIPGLISRLTVSGLQIRFLRLSPVQPAPSQRWVRYVTHSDSYTLRI